MTGFGLNIVVSKRKLEHDNHLSKFLNVIVASGIHF